MKKLLIGFLALSLVLLSFVSCNSNAVQLEDGVGSVSFAQVKAAAVKSLSATVESKQATDLYWRYTAVKKDDGGTTGGTTNHNLSNSLPVNGENKGLNTTPIAFSVGTWEFRLYGFLDYNVKDSAEYVYYSDVSTTAVVTIGDPTHVLVSVVDTKASGNGNIKLTGITVPASGYANVALKCRVDAGEWKAMTGNKTNGWSFDYASPQTPYPIGIGPHTVEVGVFNASQGLQTTDPVSTASIQVTTYRYLSNNITGSIDDLTGGVIFEADIPTQQTVVNSGTVASGSASSPEITATTAVSPDATVTGGSTYKTVVVISEGALGNDYDAGDKIETEVTVTAYSAATSVSKFVAQSDDGVAIAGIECEMKASVNGGQLQPVTDFGSTDVYVTTYILKNLTAPKLFYTGSGTQPQAYETAGSGSGYVQVYADDDAMSGRRGYSKATGKLIFSTKHFSTFQVEMNAEAMILDTNTAYETVSAAVAAATEGQTVVVLKDSTISSYLDITEDITITGVNTTTKPVLSFNRDTIGIGALFDNNNGNQGIYGASLTLKDLEIKNTNGSASGYAVQLKGKATVNAENCKFTNLYYAIGDNMCGDGEISINLKNCSFSNTSYAVSLSGYRADREVTFSGLSGIANDKIFEFPVLIKDKTNGCYATINDAIDAVETGGEIILLNDVNAGPGFGVYAPTAKTFTINLNGKTYTATSDYAGSTGYKNQVVHLEKGNTVTIKNGTISSGTTGARMIIQNYSNLTLEDIVLDGTKLAGATNYVLSNNCGNVVLSKGTSVTAKSGDIALDCYYDCQDTYKDGVTVTFSSDFTGKVTGKMEFARRAGTTDVVEHSLIVESTNGDFLESSIDIVDELRSNELIKSKDSTIKLVDTDSKYSWKAIEDNYYKAWTATVHNRTTGIGYDTLAEAVSAVATGDELELRKGIYLDETISIASKSFTLDLNGFKLATVDSTAGCSKTVLSISGTSDFVLKDSAAIGSKGLIMAGVVTNPSSSNTQGSTISVSGSANLTVDGAVVSGNLGINTKYSGHAIYFSGTGDLTVKNHSSICGGDCEKRGVTSANYSSLNYKYQGEAGDAIEFYGKNLTISDSYVGGGNGTATQGTQTAYISGGANFAISGVGLYLCGSGDTKISSSTIKGGCSALYNAEDAITFNGGKTLLIENGSTIEGGSSDGSSYGIAGAAICSYNNSNPTITVKGSNSLGGGKPGNSWIGCGFELYKACTINANGCTISGGNSGNGSGYGNAFYVNSCSPVINLTNTTLSSCNKAYNSSVVYYTQKNATIPVNFAETITITDGKLERVVISELDSKAFTVTSDDTAEPKTKVIVDTTTVTAPNTYTVSATGIAKSAQ